MSAHVMFDIDIASWIETIKAKITCHCLYVLYK